MTEKISELLFILRHNLEALIKTDLGQVRYSDADIAWLLGGALLVLLLSKIAGWWLLGLLGVWRKARQKRESSGYFKISVFRSLIPVRFLLLLSKTLLLMPVAVMLIALARPFLMTSYKETRITEHRTRVDLIDVSGSMESYFGPPNEYGIFTQSGKLKIEIAKESFLKFLETRRGKKDRASLWAFSDAAILVEDFVTDSELYYFSASYFWDQMMLAGRGGGTNLAGTLAAIYQYILSDRKEQAALFGHEPKKERVALLMVTDAAGYQYPEQELKDLKNANVVPYLIFIKENPSISGVKSNDANAKRLIDEIESYGGRYFDATNPQEMEEAYRVIDRMEAIKTKTEYLSHRIPIHKLFLALTMIGLILTIVPGIIAEFLWGQRT